jgi:hypothetical protein
MGFAESEPEMLLVLLVPFLPHACWVSLLWPCRWLAQKYLKALQDAGWSSTEVVFIFPHFFFSLSLSWSCRLLQPCQAITASSNEQAKSIIALGKKPGDRLKVFPFGSRCSLPYLHCIILHCSVENFGSRASPNRHWWQSSNGLFVLSVLFCSTQLLHLCS